MALGRRNGARQGEFWVATQQLPTSPGHVFYEKLNELLAEGKFDEWIEELCESYYAKRGRPGIPPGVYFRMLLAGYFEGIGSQRGIAWRCSDSLSLRKFLGIAPTEESPDHSSLSLIRGRLSREVHDAVFVWVLKLAREKGLLNGEEVGVDSTTLEANAAMKSIVRRDTGEDWQAYVTGLMRDAGKVGPDEKPTIEEMKRFDKARQGKKVSNTDWESPADPDSRITKMKDGTTHLAYKAEQTVDLKTDMMLSAEIYHADRGDAKTIEDTVQIAQRISWNQAAQCASETWLPTRVITRPRRSRHLPKRPRIAPTSPSRDSQLARHASGPTSHRNNATRSMPTVDGLAADVVSDCNDCAASASSDHLLMCARPAEHDGHGSAASQKLASGT